MEPVNIALSGVINWVCIYYLDVFLSIMFLLIRKWKIIEITVHGRN